MAATFGLNESVASMEACGGVPTSDIQGDHRLAWQADVPATAETGSSPLVPCGVPPLSAVSSMPLQSHPPDSLGAAIEPGGALRRDVTRTMLDQRIEDMEKQALKHGIVSTVVAEVSATLQGKFTWWQNETSRLEAHTVRSASRIDQLEAKVRELASQRAAASLVGSSGDDPSSSAEPCGDPRASARSVSHSGSDASVQQLTHWIHALDGQVTSLRTSIGEAKSDALGATASLRQDLGKLLDDREAFQQRLQTLQSHIEGEAQAVAVAGTIICEQKVEEVKFGLSMERQDRQEFHKEMMLRVDSRIQLMEASIQHFIGRVEATFRGNGLAVKGSEGEFLRDAGGADGAAHGLMGSALNVPSLSSSASCPALMPGAQTMPGAPAPGSMDFHNQDAHRLVQQTKASPASASASVDFPLDRQPGSGGAQLQATPGSASASVDGRIDGPFASSQSKLVTSPPGACGTRSVRPGSSQDLVDRKSPPPSRPGVSVHPEVNLPERLGVQLVAQQESTRPCWASSAQPGHGTPLPDHRALSPNPLSRPIAHESNAGAANGMSRSSSAGVRSEAAPFGHLTVGRRGGENHDERDQFLSEIRQLQKINASLQEEMTVRDQVLHQRRQNERPQSPQGVPRPGGPLISGSGAGAIFGTGGADGVHGGCMSPVPSTTGTKSPPQIPPTGSPASATCKAKGLNQRVAPPSPVTWRPVSLGKNLAPMKAQPNGSRTSWPARMRLPSRDAPQMIVGKVPAGGCSVDEAIVAAAAAAAQVKVQALAATGRTGHAA